MFAERTTTLPPETLLIVLQYLVGGQFTVPVLIVVADFSTHLGGFALVNVAVLILVVPFEYHLNETSQALLAEGT